VRPQLLNDGTALRLEVQDDDRNVVDTFAGDYAPDA